MQSDLDSNRQKHASTLILAGDCLGAGRIDQAERYWREYATNVPDDGEVLYNLGYLVSQRARSLSDMQEAADWLERGLESPNSSMETRSNCLNELGNLAERSGRTDKAKIGYHLALQLDPNNTAARTNFADSLRHECKFEEADQEYARALELEPGSANARMARGMLGLLLGEFERGWPDYEYRFDASNFPTPKFVSERPLWTGENLNGKTILATAEQGFGDSIMMARYFSELKKRYPNCRTAYYGHTLLMELFRGVVGLDRCFDQSDVEDFDYHVPVMSLPHRLGTTLKTIPNQTLYIWPHESWPELRLPSVSRRKVGLVWAGSPKHGKDKYRSLDPEQIQPIINAHPECAFYSLQVGPRWEEVNRLQNVTSLAEGLLGWEYTAQAIQQLDLVITVDTAVAHLAGALGKPVWVMIPHSPDFRWMLNREDSPWYPTMKLYRQSARDDWQSVIERISKDL